MKKTLLSLLIGSLFFFACKKEHFVPGQQQKSCVAQKANASNRSYFCTDIIPVNTSEKHCGMMPLSKKSFWIYQDSIFSNGSFIQTQLDTLQFTTSTTLADSLIWWHSTKEVGLPEMMYTNDSTIFLADYRGFSQDCIKDSKKEFSLFKGDSLRYLTSFEDNAAMGRSLKMTNEVTTPAGTFDDCYYYEKSAPFFRKDRIFFKPGLGVVKYISEKAEMGSPQIKLSVISTLVKFYIE